MKNVIRPGMEVQLKTGGPVMTVKSVYNDRAICEWKVVSRTCTQEFKTIYLVVAAKKYS